MAFRVKGTPAEELFRELLKMDDADQSAFAGLYAAHSIATEVRQSLEAERAKTRKAKVNGSASETASASFPIDAEVRS